MKKKQSEVKCGSVNLTKRVSAFLLGAAVALCLTAANVTVADQLPVYLGSTANFAVLTKTGISTTGTTSIVGDIGVSPAAASYLTGFGLIADASNTFSTSSLVAGKIYAADYAPPTPANMTTAVSDMETAYTDAAGRTLPDATELGAGDISGLTLVPGLYKWGTGVLIPTDVTLSGGPDDVWIFQIAGNLDISSAKSVILSGGAQAKNIFWQVAGAVTLGTTSVFNGNILAKTNIAMNTGATLNGRALAQTAVTLIANTITLPGVAPVQPPASHITVSGTNAGDVAPVVTSGGFINVVNNGAHVAATQNGTGTINIVNNGGGLTATNTGNGVMTINSTATGFVTVTNTGNGRVDVTATGSAPITLTHTGDDDFTYPSSVAEVTAVVAEMTAVNVSTSPLPVTLGLTDGFAILSYAGITNTGPTSITGDVGASPITGASMTGFETVALVGTIYTVDAAGPTGYVTDATMLTQAMLDLTTAFNDAAGRTVNPIGIAGNLGGQTLPPGLYKSTSSLEISSGDLTLDAQGDANAVWIFQIASSFNMTSGRQVFLIGGAKASNIFWQVGSSATFGTTAKMKGTIIAYATITFATGASLEGRALARTASVTLDANVVTKDANVIAKRAKKTAVENGLTSNEFSLSQNFPNPFNPTTKIHYALPYNSKVKITVYNMLGQNVAELVNAEMTAGYQEVVWQATVPSGIYFYHVEAVSVADPDNRFVDTKKMILLR